MNAAGECATSGDGPMAAAVSSLRPPPPPLPLVWLLLPPPLLLPSAGKGLLFLSRGPLMRSSLGTL